MPTKLESFECILCGKVWSDNNGACLCEHSHIKMYLKDRIEINSRGTINVYKYVEPPPPVQKTIE